jgi:hypothetical protein
MEILINNLIKNVDSERLLAAERLRLLKVHPSSLQALR